ncbi:hypothetical protein ACOZ9A_001551 [Vibrio parahaemolyticus]
MKMVSKNPVCSLLKMATPIVNADHIQKLMDRMGEMKREGKSFFEIEKFETAHQNPSEVESYQEFLSEHKDNADRVLLIVDSKRFEVCEETLSVFKEMLNHIDVHTVVDGKTYTESAQIEDLRESLRKSYQD